MNQKSSTHHLSSTIPMHDNDHSPQKSPIIKPKTRNSRRQLSAQLRKSVHKISNNDQGNSSQSSNKSLLKSKDNKASFRNIQQGYDQRSDTPSEGLFDDNKLVQQVFVRHSLTLNNSSYYSPPKQQQNNSSCDDPQLKNNLQSQKIEQIPVQLNRNGTKEGSFATLEGKKATEIVNQSLQNSIRIEVKIQNGSMSDNKNLQYSIKPMSVVEAYKIQNGLAEQDINSNQKNTQQKSQIIEALQSQAMSKIKNQGYGVISNLLDQQKAQVRQHRYSHSQETASQVQGRSNLISGESGSFKQMDNVQPLHKQNQQQNGHGNLIIDSHNQSFYKEGQHSSHINQRREVSNNYKEYLKNKLQYNYPQQSSQQMESTEEDSQRILKGGIIVGKQVQRTRKNTSYGKGISVFENLLQRKQQQQQQMNSSSQVQDQKNLGNNIHKQNQSTFTQSFYQNLIKQSKRLNNLINQQETDWNRKQRYITAQIKNSQFPQDINQDNLTDVQSESKQNTPSQSNSSGCQMKPNQILSSSKNNFQSIEFQDTTLFSCTQESFQNYSDKEIRVSEENKQELGEKYSNYKELIKKQSADQMQNSQLYEGDSVKELVNLGNIERPYSSSVNRSGKNFNGQFQVKASPESYNFKKRQILHINPEMNQIQQELNDSTFSLSSNFTDKVIKHFRFASTMKNNEIRHPSQFRKQRNCQFDSATSSNYLQIEDQRDENSIEENPNQSGLNQIFYSTQQQFYKKQNEEEEQELHINNQNKHPLSSRTSNLLNLSKNSLNQLVQTKQTEKIQNDKVSLKYSNPQLMNQRGSFNIPNSSRIQPNLSHQVNHQQPSYQDKRRSLCLENSKGGMHIKNNSSAYSISPDKRGQSNTSKKIQNYVSELVNKYSFHSRKDEECGPWVGEEEDEGNEVDVQQ